MKKLLENVRKQSPLIQNITNYVTANDCANITLACGASPIMADSVEEAEDMAKLCSGLNINMGTLHPSSVRAMVLAGKTANLCGHPVVLDPVGAGASAYRRETAALLLEKIHFTVIRGNISEIKTIAGCGGNSKGVDAHVADSVTEENLEQTVSFARKLSEQTSAVISISGAIDVVADRERAYIIRNGHPVMSQITGCGCMLSSMTAAFLAANPDKPLEAAAAAVTTMGLCGEKAYDRMIREDAGNSTCRNYIIDEVYKMTGEKLEKGANYERY